MTATPKLSPDVGSQNRVLIEKLKTEIFALINNQVENRYWIGKKLAQLQQERAKPGHGTFLADVEELGIPRATAYRYMVFYRRVAAGFDPTPVRLSQADKDQQRNAWGAAWDEVEGPTDEYDAERAADAEHKRLQEYIQAEAATVEKARVANKGRPAGYRVRLILTDKQRDKFKKAFKQLGEKKASQAIYKAVLNAAH
jgi:hypothetical protein